MWQDLDLLQEICSSCLWYLLRKPYFIPSHVSETATTIKILNHFYWPLYHVVITQLVFWNIGLTSTIWTTWAEDVPLLTLSFLLHFKIDYKVKLLSFFLRYTTWKITATFLAFYLYVPKQDRPSQYFTPVNNSLENLPWPWPICDATETLPAPVKASQFQICRPSLEERRWISKFGPFYIFIFLFQLLQLWASDELKTNAICSRPTASIAHALKVELTRRLPDSDKGMIWLGIRKCKHNIFTDSLRCHWSAAGVYKCTVSS